MTLYDEIQMLTEKLSAEWGSVVIACDGEGCDVSDPGGEKTYTGNTLLEALQNAEKGNHRQLEDEG